MSPTPERPDLQALLAKWQKILRLQDWQIKIEFRRKFDMPEYKQGTVGFNAGKKMAAIGIIDPIDYSPKSDWPQDVEGTIVHELLHLHFGLTDTSKSGSLEEDLWEQAINSLETALVGLDRK